MAIPSVNRVAFFSGDTMRTFSKKGKEAVLHNLRAAITECFGTQLRYAKAADIHAVKLNRVVNGWAQPTTEEHEGLITDARRPLKR